MLALASSLIHNTYPNEIEKWIISGIVENTENTKDMSAIETEDFVGKEVMLDSRTIRIGDGQWRITNIEDDIYSRDDFNNLFRTSPAFIESHDQDIRIRMIDCEGLSVSIVSATEKNDFLFLKLQFFEMQRSK